MAMCMIAKARLARVGPSSLKAIGGWPGKGGAESKAIARIPASFQYARRRAAFGPGGAAWRGSSSVVPGWVR